MKIVQFYVNHNLRGGEKQLTIDVDGLNHELPIGNFFFFLNKKRNIIKVLGSRGMYTEHLPENETFDFKLRLLTFLNRVGTFFQLDLVPTSESVEKLESLIKGNHSKHKAPTTKKKRKAA